MQVELPCIQGLDVRVLCMYNSSKFDICTNKQKMRDNTKHMQVISMGR